LNLQSIELLCRFITRFQWALLILAAPFLLFPSDRRSLFLLVVPLLWLVAWIGTKKPLPLTPLNLPSLLIFIMVLVSLYATYDISYSLPKVSGMVLGIGMFFALLNSAQAEKNLKASLMLFLVVGLGVAGVGLFGMQQFNKLMFLKPLVEKLPVAIRGLPGAENGLHPNEVAGSVLWVLPFLFAFSVLGLIKRKNWTIQIGKTKTSLIVAGLVLAALFMSAVLLLSQSRGGLIALVLTATLALGLILPGRWRAGFLVGIFVVGIGFAVTAWGLGWVEKLAAAPNAGDNPALSLNTLNGRIEVWSRAIYGIQDFPFTGMGMNTFRKVVHVLYPLFSIGPDFDFGHAHNEFLQAALDLGLPGLIAFIAIYLVAVWMLVKCWKWSVGVEETASGTGLTALLSSPDAVKTMVLGLGGGLLAHAFYGLTDAVALGAKPGILLWILLGLVTGLYLDQAERQRSARSI
jgi:putative inorganic carbon (HCO3(-)) transporter